MIYKPENVKLVITHNGVGREVHGFDQSTCSDECSVMTEEQLYRLLCEISNTKEVSKRPKPKSSRCKDTVDWVEVEYGDEYKKPKKGEVGY